MNAVTDELVPVSALREGDLVDLEGDPYAGSVHDDPDHELCLIALEFEYCVVASIERETPVCVRVDFDNWDSVGFPPLHRVRRAARSTT